MGGTRVRAHRRRDRPAAHGQGRGRDRPARGRRCRRRPGGRPAARAARSRSSGRTEADVSAEISARLIAEGHDKVNFAIVAAGANAASPHHHACDRVIARRRDRAVRLRRHHGTATAPTSPAASPSASPRPRSPTPTPCSTRPRPPAWPPVTSGVPCEEVDGATRRIIAAAGYGEYFIHRTGHGIGMEEHEDPYMVSGNHAAAGRRPRLLGGARHLRARPFRHAPGGHRGGHRRRAASPQPRQPRPGRARPLSAERRQPPLMGASPMGSANSS